MAALLASQLPLAVPALDAQTRHNPTMKPEFQYGFSNFRPNCLVNLHGKCEQGGRLVAGEYYCDFHDKNVANYLDRGLVVHLVAQLSAQSVIEFGAGEGCYTGAIHDQSQIVSHGVASIQGFEHKRATKVEWDTEHLVRFADPVTPGFDNWFVGCADYVLSLEDMHHVAPWQEKVYLDTLDDHNTRGIIISWPDAPRIYSARDEQNRPYEIVRDFGHDFNSASASPDFKNGTHVNYASSADVIKRMSARGYVLDEEATTQLRTAASAFPWLSNSLYHFRRGVDLKLCRRPLPGQQADQQSVGALLDAFPDAKAAAQAKERDQQQVNATASAPSQQQQPPGSKSR